jgi:hypothetical protein
MSLTKETVVDKIEVLESNAIQVRSAIRVLEDGEVLSSSYHRHVLQPGDDLSNEDPKVVAIANAAWALSGVLEDVSVREVNDLIQSGDKRLTVAAADVAAVPSTADRVLIGGVTHQIIRVTTIEQDNTAITHELILRA